MDTPLFKAVSQFCELFPKKIEADDLVYLLSLSKFQEKGYFDDDQQIINYMICLSANFHRELVYNCLLATMKLVSPVDLSEHISQLVGDYLENQDNITIGQNLVEELAGKWVDFENGKMADYMNDFIDKIDIPMDEPSHDEDSKESYQVEMEHPSVEDVSGEEEERPVKESSQEEEKPVEEVSSEQEEEKPIEEVSSEQEEDKPVEVVSSQEEEKPVEEVSSQEEEKPVEEISSEQEEKPIEEVSSQEEEKPVEEVSGEEEEKPIEEISSEQEEEPTEVVSGEEEEKPIEEVSGEEEEPLKETEGKDEPTQETTTEEHSEIPKSTEKLEASKKGNYCSYINETDCRKMSTKKNMPCYWIAEEDGTSHCEQKTEVSGGSVLFGEYKPRRKFYK